MNDTPNLALPYMLAAQAQKHVTHNEAIRALDALVQLSILDRDLAVPPVSPADGERYIVAASPTGAWAGRAGHVAAFQDGAWIFYTPKADWAAWIADEAATLVYNGTAWVSGVGSDQVSNSQLAEMGAGTIKGNNTAGSANPIDLNAAQVKSMLAISASDVSGLGSAAIHVASDFDAAGAASAAIATHVAASDPHPQYHNDSRGDARYMPLSPSMAGINATADATNRLALKSTASLFDNVGNGHQQKINKAAPGDTASQLYQTGYSGRAEIGLTGDDDFHFKVSPDGSSWFEALKIDRNTGRVDMQSTGRGRNRLINPCGRFAIAGVASTSDGSYTGFDQWYALTQTAAILPSQLTDVENATPYMMRLTQASVTAQRFGLAQPLETIMIKDMRGQQISLSARVRASVALTLRYAVLEWQGTADSITKDVVSDWTSPSFAPAGFFLASNVAVVGSGSTALSANALTDVVANALRTRQRFDEQFDRVFLDGRDASTERDSRHQQSAA